MMTEIVAVLLAGTLALGSRFAAAQNETLELLVIEMADAAVEHAALGRYFRTRAEEARQEVLDLQTSRRPRDIYSMSVSGEES